MNDTNSQTTPAALGKNASEKTKEATWKAACVGQTSLCPIPMGGA